MKKTILLIIMFVITQQLFSQNPTRITFEYDSAGNQILRNLCINCNTSKNSNSVPEEISKLNEDDLIKFFDEDVISYYPNPVIEELYLKWELINENKVSKIDIYNINGQIIMSFKELEKEKSKTISFIEYPAGVYFLYLNYMNGDQKSIKIIKN